MSTTQDIVFYVECYCPRCEEMYSHNPRCYMCYLAYNMIMKGEY